MGVIFTSVYNPLAHGAVNWDTQLRADIGALGNIVNGAINIGSGADLNGYNFQGVYNGFSLTNAPAGSADSFIILVLASLNGAAAIQLAFRFGTGNYLSYRRFYVSGVGWTAWATF